MRPPSSKAYSASNDSLFNAIDFFAPRPTKNKYLDIPHGASLPILNSLQRSLTPAPLNSPEAHNTVLDDKKVRQFFQGNDSPEFNYGRNKRGSSTSDVTQIPNIEPIQHDPNPHLKIHINSIEPRKTNVVVNRKNQLPTKRKLPFKESNPLFGEKWLPTFTILPKKTWAESAGQEKCKLIWKGILQGVYFIVIIFLFLVAYELLSISLTLIMGKAYMNVLTHRHVSKNPLGILMFGILTGVFTENFIYPSAIVAKLVETDKLPLNKSIYILYGLHIGCTASCFFVATIFFSNKHKLCRGSGMAALYYIVNMMTVIVLLPFEVIVGMVANLTEVMLLSIKTWTPQNCQVVRRLVLGITDYIVQIDFKHGATFEKNKRWIRDCSQNHTTKHCVYLFKHPSLILSDGVIGLIILIFVILLWSLCFFALVKLLNILFRGTFANRCQDYINKRWPVAFPWLGEFVMCLTMTTLTIILQNQTVILIICTLLTARGVFGISRMFSIVIGCNLGNSLSLILVSLSDQSQTFLHIGIMCLVYNILGFFAWFITPCMGHLMKNAAARLGDNTATYKWLLPVLITILFIIVPVLLTSLSAAGLGIFLLITLPLTLIFINVVAINAVLQYNPKLIPKRLQIWRFLPEFCVSLEPYDEIYTRHLNKRKLQRQQKRNEKIKARHRKGDPLEFWERSRVSFYKSDFPQNRSDSVATRTATMSSIYV